jgi:hypothetical protein
MALTLHVKPPQPAPRTTMRELSLDAMTMVIGGTTATDQWDSIRTQAGPHCPKTVARYHEPPADRSQAQTMGEACLAEMGSFKAAFARSRIQAGIDLAFPPNQP